MTNIAIPCYVYRGGTSKGLYFLADDLPQDEAERDRLLLSVMGSPDERQIDGMGGAHPLTSKVAIVRKSDRAGIDVAYLFLQVSVDKAEVSDNQNCGNILAGVGPFAIENGLKKIEGSTTDVRIYLENTDSVAVARIETPNGAVNYSGDEVIDGVPGGAAPISIQFEGIEGASCGALFPSGTTTEIDGLTVTCVDNGMPVVLIRACDLGLEGSESPADLEANSALKSRIERLRLKAGELMNLGDVTPKTVPKMSIISAAQLGGLVNTRTFIPHRVHEAIGVLGAVSVATACLVPGTVAYGLTQTSNLAHSSVFSIEHPTGAFQVEMELDVSDRDKPKVLRAALIRTARLLMRGEVYAHANINLVRE